MRRVLSRVEYQRLRSLLRDAQALQSKVEGIHRMVRRLVGWTKRDGEMSNDHIFDLVWNDVPLEGTLEALGITVEDS